MDNYEEMFKSYDLNFFGTGSHKVTFEQMIELLKQDKAYVVDLRTKEENDILSFSFATSIPVENFTSKMNELPKDKTIILFCSTATRATMIFTYLRANGYENTKILTESIGDLANHFKPGFVLKNLEAFKK